MNAVVDEFACFLKATEQSGRRATIVNQCASTQDIARESGPGAIVLARHQTAGRGRLGRAWADTADAGLAMSLTLDARTITDPGVLSIGVGLAACIACEQVLIDPQNSAITTPATTALGLRWPNDVVERTHGRKLAGVLIERSADLFVVGVGINCLQGASDWPDVLHGRAVSLVELAPQLDRTTLRAGIAIELLRSIDRVLTTPPDQIARGWSARDTLVGTRRVFEHAGNRIVATVVSVDPLSHLIVRDDAGTLHRLPALTTSMVHDASA
ncbi:MAG: biotin--[acetyl-CoA-carboxylase] ligase [Phycisphaerales bacterium]|nr:biotin--[acetyl-CoA-carboxylase] ligase [Phycisphaerales bacterium]